MRPLGILAAWTATLYFALPSAAWNSTGHRIIAAIAYERLTPETRIKVDALIQAHPDYSRFIRNAPADPAARARAAFMAASIWPDDIKGDPRFWDDTHDGAVPTPILPGFSDMKRHVNWHYYDTPYSPDHKRVPKPKPPSALTELPRLIRELGSAPESIRAYDLPWIEHILGDIHQPLHCISRFLKSEPRPDAGGNSVILVRYRNLHSLWDESAGNNPSDEYVARYAAGVAAETPPPDRLGRNALTNVRAWIQEGAKIAKTEVYTFGDETGSQEHPLELAESYVENSHQVARARVALAGYRLAIVLNQRLK
jgi:hypothetical protein